MKTKYVEGIKWIAGASFQLTKFLVRNPQAFPTTVDYFIHWSKEVKRSLGKVTNLEEEKKEFEILLSRHKDRFDSTQNLDRLETWKIENDNRWVTLYTLVRLLQPDIVVETGVAAGESTGHILQAMKDNGKGELYSIDLPNQFYIHQGIFHAEYNPSGRLPGYLVPKILKDRWNLILGDTYKELPKLLDNLGQINIFLHDSEHTYKTMMFEYKEAWPHIKQGGYLITDDEPWNKAFKEFSQSKGIAIYGQGYLRKI